MAIKMQINPQSIIPFACFFCLLLIYTNNIMARGEPRVQYERTYWVINDPGNLQESQVRSIAEQAFDDSKRTLGYSFDDAGIGDLNVRNVVVWGWPKNNMNTLLNWYKTYYSGVKVSFRSLPLPGQKYYSYGPYSTNPPSKNPPSKGRGKPRIDYPREYWVLDGNVATKNRFVAIAIEAFKNSKQTVGFSFDDAGIGDLNSRKVVVKEIGNYTQQALIDFYSTYYPGVNVFFNDNSALGQKGLVINIGWPLTFPSSDQIKNLKPDIVRTIVYARHYSNGRYTTLDEAIRRYQGLTKICVIINSEGLYPSRPKRDAIYYLWRDYINQFSEHVKHLAQVYNGQVYAWEIWNEQDNFESGIRPDIYAELLDETLKKIKDVSSAKVISGGLYTGEAENYLMGFISLMSQYKLLDGVGFHPYGKKVDKYPICSDMAKCNCWNGDLKESINKMYNIAQKPLWITEIGVPYEDFDSNDGDPQIQQGEYLKRVYKEFANIGKNKVATGMWFAWHDGIHGYEPELSQHFGLCFSDNLIQRPAWYQFSGILHNQIVNSCAPCVISNRPDILPFYQSNGWDISESNWDNIINNWCSIDPAGCAKEKVQCGSACNTAASTAQCIINNRPDILPFYQSNGWDISESNWDNIISNWCTIDPAGCEKEKAKCK